MKSSESKPSARRLWSFRLGAILFGLTLLLVLELALRLAGVQRYLAPAAPLIGFNDTRPLFAKDSDNGVFQIPESRRTFFQKDSFSIEKSPDEFRVFCLGGSTVQGRPYSIETSFTKWLELDLQAADPSKTWQVVNCGGVSYASYRLVPVLREVLHYEPDLIILYTGHNEFLEERTYSDIKRRPAWFQSIQDHVLDLRIANVIRSLTPKPPTASEINLPAEVDALLDYQGGLAKYHRDDAWRDGVIHEYEQNLLKMIEMTREARVPLLLCNPVSNIRDTAPFKVELPEHLSAEQCQEFESRWEAAKQAPWEDLQAKQKLVEGVLEIDERHAEAHFLLAKIYESQGDIKAASRAYLQAKDEDVCPLRMLESMHAVLKRAAARTGARLIDIRAIFEAGAEHGIPGDVQLIDHVHPRIEGHQRIAEVLMDALAEDQYVVLQDGWQQRQQDSFKQNYASLPDNYFPESVERLRGLQRWAEGRVMRLKPDGKQSQPLPNAADMNGN